VVETCDAPTRSEDVTYIGQELTMIDAALKKAGIDTRRLKQ
jgi:hypothetical protein